MNKLYLKTPLNFNEIENFLMTNDYEQYFFTAKHCYFYDTCSLRGHSNSINRSKIIEYIKSTNGIVVIPRIIIMELQDNDNNIHPIQIEYIKEMYTNNIKVILLEEESTINILKYALDITISECNTLLGQASYEISELNGTIKIIQEDDTTNTIRSLMNRSIKGEQYTSFFELIRSKKESNDNLGEEIMYICFILLARTCMTGKLVFLSNDTKSYTDILSINNTTFSKFCNKQPYQLTTVSLVDKMYKSSLISSKCEISDLLNSSFKGNKNIFFTGEYDIAMQNSSFSIDEISNMIIDDSVTIYY